MILHSAKRLDNGEIVKGNICKVLGEFYIFLENGQVSYPVDKETISPDFTSLVKLVEGMIVDQEKLGNHPCCNNRDKTAFEYTKAVLERILKLIKQEKGEDGVIQYVSQDDEKKHIQGYLVKIGNEYKIIEDNLIHTINKGYLLPCYDLEENMNKIIWNINYARNTSTNNENKYTYECALTELNIVKKNLLKLKQIA